MLRFIILSVIMVRLIILSVIMLSVSMLFVILLSVIMQSVSMLSVLMLSVIMVNGMMLSVTISVLHFIWYNWQTILNHLKYEPTHCVIKLYLALVGVVWCECFIFVIRNWFQDIFGIILLLVILSKLFKKFKNLMIPNLYLFFSSFSDCWVVSNFVIFH
jgi:hypothetical protein